jgi:hypothetical protein
MATLQELTEAFRTFTQAGEIDSARQVLALIRAEQQREKDAREFAPDDPGAMGTLMIGAGRTVDRLGKGMKQLYLGATGDKEGLARLKEQAEDDDRAYAPLQEARPFMTGLGEALPAVLVPGGAATSLARAVGQSAAIGAALPALEYGSASERAKRAAVGAAAGAAAPLAGAAAVRGATGVARGARALTRPFTGGGREEIVENVLRTAAGSGDPAVVNRLLTARPAVPGSMPTAAQVGESGGLAALEKSVSIADPEAYVAREASQRAARLKALDDLAGSPEQLARLRDIREAAAKKSYKHAYMAGVDQDMAAALKPQIDMLLERPSIQKAMAAAKEMAKEESVALDDFGSVQGLHFLKEALDDQIEQLGGQGAKRAQRRLLQTKDDLMSVLQEIAPEYKAANERFARLSKPINRMEVGQKLRAELEPALNDSGGMLAQRGEKFANTLREGDRFAKRALGFKGAKLSNVLKPEDMQMLEALKADLARAANAKRIGAGRSVGTFNNLIVDDLIESAGSPKVVRAVMETPLLGRATRWGYQDQDVVLRHRLAQLMLDPQATGNAIVRSQARAARKAANTRKLRAAEAQLNKKLLLPASMASGSAIAQNYEDPLPSADELSLELPNE